ncbi:protein NYNRIN-like [Mercenaria mercenaria]|uniref:protein NYNRIN-like n=1 Tax=Mercenaria mercenaria TaxID=6596 RepID=UPI00234E41F4|nr:protein NYNRIN-like [Mercenaria mercenaria]
MERCALDIQGPYPTSNKGMKYILVVGDYFTKFLQAIPLKCLETKYVATKLVNKFISLLGTPLELFSDRGSNFESTIFKEMCELLGIHKTRTTVGRPSSDGMIERANRVIQNMMTAFVDRNQRNWCEKLPLLVLAYNSSVHTSTGFSPSMMMFGREMNLPIDLAIGKPVDEKNKVHNKLCNRPRRDTDRYT